jgi:hypothetical protein
VPPIVGEYAKQKKLAVRPPQEMLPARPRWRMRFRILARLRYRERSQAERV